jgi:hypothetical protein
MEWKIGFIMGKLSASVSREAQPFAPETHGTYGTESMTGTLACCENAAFAIARLSSGETRTASCPASMYSPKMGTAVKVGFGELKRWCISLAASTHDQ